MKKQTQKHKFNNIKSIDLLITKTVEKVTLEAAEKVKQLHYLFALSASNLIYLVKTLKSSFDVNFEWRLDINIKSRLDSTISIFDFDSIVEI